VLGAWLVRSQYGFVVIFMWAPPLLQLAVVEAGANDDRQMPRGIVGAWVHTPGDRLLWSRTRSSQAGCQALHAHPIFFVRSPSQVS
jgi:hypothetical protein